MTTVSTNPHIVRRHLPSLLPFCILAPLDTKMLTSLNTESLSEPIHTLDLHPDLSIHLPTDAISRDRNHNTTTTDSFLLCRESKLPHDSLFRSLPVRRPGQGFTGPGAGIGIPGRCESGIGWGLLPQPTAAAERTKKERRQRKGRRRWWCSGRWCWRREWSGRPGRCGCWRVCASE
jgi:hypothetical protein